MYDKLQSLTSATKRCRWSRCNFETTGHITLRDLLKPNLPRAHSPLAQNPNLSIRRADFLTAACLKPGEFWATYEPAQVRKFLHGRTACVRSLSSAAKEWVLAMETAGDRRPTARRMELLQKAAASHIEYARSASEVRCVVTGRGVAAGVVGYACNSCSVR